MALKHMSTGFHFAIAFQRRTHGSEKYRFVRPIARSDRIDVDVSVFVCHGCVAETILKFRRADETHTTIQMKILVLTSLR
jgi:hypothetical protein